MLVGIRAGLRPAILGLPLLVKTLRQAGSVAEGVAARAVRDAVDIVVAVPVSWHEMLREAGISASALEN